MLRVLLFGIRPGPQTPSGARLGTSLQRQNARLGAFGVSRPFGSNSFEPNRPSAVLEEIDDEVADAGREDGE